MGALAATLVVGPHYFIDNEAIDGNLLLSAGTENLKSMELNFLTPLYRGGPWRLGTRATLQIFDKTNPSVIRYNIGMAYDWKASLDWMLQPFLGVAVQSYESSNRTQVGPSGGLLALYRIHDRMKIISQLKMDYLDRAIWSASAGLRRHSDKDGLLAPDVHYDLMVGYEQNDETKKRITFISVGFFF